MSVVTIGAPIEMYERILDERLRKEVAGQMHEYTRLYAYSLSAK